MNTLEFVLCNFLRNTLEVVFLTDVSAERFTV